MIKANLLFSRHFIKINACFIGYGLWILLSQNQIITRNIPIPLCFYTIPKNMVIIAPDTINLTISSQKKNLQKFDVENSAIHLNASTLHEGSNYIVLQKENIFLPDNINLINLIPASIHIQLQKVE